MKTFKLYTNLNASDIILYLQEGKCYCLDSLPDEATPLSNRECTSNCPGDKSQTCGGKGTLSVLNYRYKARGNS